MPKTNEYLIDTDVIQAHLTHKPLYEVSHLELLMQKGLCFSTVLNASQLLYDASSKSAQQLIIDVLSALKILGIHSRYSLLIPKYSDLVANLFDALFCVFAEYNKLPIVTLKKTKYSKTGLKVCHPSELVSPPNHQNKSLST